MPTHNEKYPDRLGLEPGTSRLQPQWIRINHRGRPLMMVYCILENGN